MMWTWESGRAFRRAARKTCVSLLYYSIYGLTYPVTRAVRFVPPFAYQSRIHLYVYSTSCPESRPYFPLAVSMTSSTIA